MKLQLIILISAILLNPTLGQNNKKINDADKAFNNRNYIRALVMYEDILKETDSKNYHYALYKKAYCNYYLTNYKEAVIDIKKALKIDTSNLDYNWIRGNSYWLYGRIYSKLDKKKKSLKYLYKAIKYIQPSSLYSTIGFKEIQIGQYEKALKNLNIAIQLDTTNAYAFNNRALVYLKLSDFEKARIDVNKSIQLDNRNPYAYKHSAMIYIELKEFEKACIELSTADELGYATFGNESDSNEVESLINKYCKTLSDTK